MLCRAGWLVGCLLLLPGFPATRAASLAAGAYFVYFWVFNPTVQHSLAFFFSFTLVSAQESCFRNTSIVSVFRNFSRTQYSF